MIRELEISMSTTSPPSTIRMSVVSRPPLSGLAQDTTHTQMRLGRVAVCVFDELDGGSLG